MCVVDPIRPSGIVVPGGERGWTAIAVMCPFATRTSAATASASSRWCASVPMAMWRRRVTMIHPFTKCRDAPKHVFMAVDVSMASANVKRAGLDLTVASQSVAYVLMTWTAVAMVAGVLAQKSVLVSTDSPDPTARRTFVPVLVSHKWKTTTASTNWKSYTVQRHFVVTQSGEHGAHLVKSAR